jgi:CelD/BcsL family acetyltransferase involved in cellulose biosynthesis
MLLELDDPRWTSFVDSRADALPYHHPAWAGVLRDAYGYRCFALLGEAGGLPLAETRGRRWVSLPFTDECPPLGAVDELLESARAEHGVRRVDIHAAADGFPVAAGVAHSLPLELDADAVYARFRKTQVRQPIEKAARDGVVVRAATVPGDLTGLFYDLHVRTRRRHGVPVQPRRFFDLLWERIVEPGLGFVLVAEAGGVAVAAAVFLTWNGTVTYKYSASDPAHWLLRPNNLLLWTAIRRGCVEGYRTFDLGRSDTDNAGLRAFKAGWGAAERPLVYTVVADEAPRVAGGRAAAMLAPVIRRSPAIVCRGVGELLYKYAA